MHVTKGIRKLNQFSIPSAILFVFFTLLILPIILTPYENYQKFFVSTNEIVFSHITKSEFDMVSWVKNNVDVKKNPNSYLISDYATAFLLRGITDLNTTADRPTTMNIGEWQKMQSTIHDLFTQKINNQTYDTVDKIQNETQSDIIYLVISKRTCWWTNTNNSLSIRYLPLPEGYSFNNYCSQIDKKFHDNTRFQEIFRNTDNVVYLYKKGE